MKIDWLVQYLLGWSYCLLRVITLMKLIFFKIHSCYYLPIKKKRKKEKSIAAIS